ncbi:MAG: DUF6263 family protein [Bacteroidia bacterium]
MVYKQVTKTAQTSEQKVMGMSTKTSQTTEIFLKNEVVSVSGKGALQDSRCTYERVKAEMENSMMGKMSYDSDKDIESSNPGWQLQGADLGKSIQFDMDNGTVVAVSGVDSLFESILGSIGGEEGGAGMEATKNALKATFGDDAMKSMMQSAAISIPTCWLLRAIPGARRSAKWALCPLRWT